MWSIVLSFSGLLVGAFALYAACRDRRLFIEQVKELQSRVDEAKKIAERRGELANEIAHDIKNPLTAILCSAEALDLLIGHQLDPLHRSTLRYIREYGDTLLQLMTDLLDVHRAEAGQLPTKPSRVLVGSVASSVVGILRAQADKRGVHLNQDIDESAEAFCDSKQVRQILFNLVHNGIKFTNSGGNVTVQIYRSRDGVVVAVNDTGVGIPEKLIPKLFNPYSRYDKEDRPRFEVSIGLGLALTKVLTELNGGNISVYSKEGEGTRFEIWLPPWKGGRKDALLPSLRNEPPLPLIGQKFLVVDEDSKGRESLSSLIRDLGGVVNSVREAADAVEEVFRDDYDAVMINRDGDPDSAEHLVGMIKDGRKDTTTVLLTSQSLAATTRDDRVDHYLERPFNRDALLKSLIRSGKYQITH